MAGYTERMENRGLNAFAIRLIATVAMIWGSVQQLLGPSPVDWATYMLWFSYTLFAFLLAEGVNKSSDRVLYFRRFLLFTIISEPCYDLLFSGKLWDPQRQSIMLTLLLGLIVLLITDRVRKHFDNMILTALCLIILGYLATTAAVLLKAEIGTYGILLIAIFFISLNVTYTRIMELVCFVLFLMYVAADNYFNIMINDFYYSIPDKAFALLAVIVTWFYNGKRGPNSLILKWAFYASFPVLMLILWFIKSIILKQNF